MLQFQNKIELNHADLIENVSTIDTINTMDVVQTLSTIVPQETRLVYPGDQTYKK